MAPASDSVLWILAVLIFFSTLIVVLRIFCKSIRGRPIRWDDYTLVTAWVSIFSGGRGGRDSI